MKDFKALHVGDFLHSVALNRTYMIFEKDESAMKLKKGANDEWIVTKGYYENHINQFQHIEVD